MASLLVVIRINGHVTPKKVTYYGYCPPLDHQSPGISKIKITTRWLISKLVE